MNDDARAKRPPPEPTQEENSGMDGTTPMHITDVANVTERLHAELMTAAGPM